MELIKLIFLKKSSSNCNFIKNTEVWICVEKEDIFEEGIKRENPKKCAQNELLTEF